MADEIMSLAGAAPTVTYEDWIAAAEAVLKGRSFDKVLRSNLEDGIVVEPLYTRADESPVEQVPGAATGRRGSNPAGSTSGWDIRQRHSATEVSSTNAAIRRDLERGVTSIELDMAGIDDEETLAAVLDGVLLDLAPVSLTGARDQVAAARLLLEVAKRNDVAGSALLAHLGCDPLGHLAVTGSASQSRAEAAALAADLSRGHPGVRVFRCDSTPYAHAGAGPATELAALLSTGVAYLRAMEAAGLDVDPALAQVLLVTSVGTDQFVDIAKLRALRVLWARVAEASGADAASTHVQAVTSASVLSKRDPWVNMLRATIGCFAAAVGGADSITVRTFDELLGVPDELGVRIARNTQLVLMEESNLHRVIDPAGGSWYVESLTDQLATAAWTRFQEIESGGGIETELRSGSIQDRIADTWESQRRAVATRRRPITGVSEYPDVAEAAVTRVPPPNRETDHGDDAEPLPLRRLAADFERLRDTAESADPRPTVFLANLGTGVEHSTRSTWAKNFFEAGGIAAIANDGFSDDQSLVAALEDSGARLAVLCSSDSVYADRAVAAARALADSGLQKLYLAGNPGDSRAAYEAAGVDDFVFIGCDVVDTLEGALSALGLSISGGAA